MKAIYPFSELLVTWRTSEGERRIPIGVLKIEGEKAYFAYSSDGVSRAKKMGFDSYPGLPLEKEIDQDIAMNLFTRRVINTERSDAKRLLQFLHIDLSRLDDKLYLLGVTSGKTATDHFEFLPRLQQTSEDYVFVTDLAGLKYYDADIETLKEGEELIWERDKDNEYDPQAVFVKDKHNNRIGYIKQSINNIFHQSDNVRVYVYNIINTGNMQTVFVRLEIPHLE